PPARRRWRPVAVSGATAVRARPPRSARALPAVGSRTKRQVDTGRNQPWSPFSEGPSRGSSNAAPWVGGRDGRSGLGFAPRRGQSRLSLARPHYDNTTYARFILSKFRPLL